jgi:hypothetical protein
VDSTGWLLESGLVIAPPGTFTRPVGLLPGVLLGNANDRSIGCQSIDR